MRAISSCALSLSLLLCACAARELSVPLSPQAASRVAEACRDLDRVDLARIPAGMPDWRRFDALHEQARAGLAATDPAEGATLLRLAIRGGSFVAPTDLSVWAARRPDGVWRVSHVRHSQYRPPPQPPGTPPLPSPPPRAVITGTLTPQAAALVDAALGSDCLDREPYLSPSTLPLKGGSDLQCPPDGGSDNALEIVEAGTTRRYLRECGRTWATGTIIVALENRDNLIPD